MTKCGVWFLYEAKDRKLSRSAMSSFKDRFAVTGFTVDKVLVVVMIVSSIKS